jgi:hypothetical protein
LGLLVRVQAQPQRLAGPEERGKFLVHGDGFTVSWIAAQPRSSTRSPRASADAISLKIVATTVAMSSSRRDGFAVPISAMSSDLVKAAPQLVSGAMPDTVSAVNKPT